MNWGEKKNISVIGTKYVFPELLEPETRKNLYYSPDTKAIAVLRTLKEEESHNYKQKTDLHRQKQDKIMPDEATNDD